MAVRKSIFGLTSCGQEVHIYCITNKSGASIEVLDIGASLRSLQVPDKYGKLRDVVLGFDSAEAYETSGTFFGATVGRCANRISGGRFTIDDITYHMDLNDNGNNLHSGYSSYEKRIWDVIDVSDNYVTLSLLCPDGDQGFPGEFRVFVTYTLTDCNEVMIHYQGVSNKDTIVNLTNHSYFNLGGHSSGSALNQKLWIDADAFTPVKNAKSIPTGIIEPVSNTPFDFTVEKSIGKDIGEGNEQLLFGNGYDHNFVLNKWNKEIRLVAKARCEESGIIMEVLTDLPGMQLYTGNFVNCNNGKGGAIYSKHSAFCLETQYFPNAVNEPLFPSPVLKKGEEYKSTTIYRFFT